MPAGWLLDVRPEGPGAGCFAVTGAAAIGTAMSGGDSRRLIFVGFLAWFAMLPLVWSSALEPSFSR